MCGYALVIRMPAVPASRRRCRVAACRSIRATAVEQDRAAGAGANRPVDGAPDGGWQRDQDDLAAFTAHAQHPVAMLFAEIGDIRAGGLEDPQAEHGYACEVARGAVTGGRRCAGPRTAGG
jgi:hypothetical protein